MVALLMSAGHQPIVEDNYLQQDRAHWGCQRSNHYELCHDNSPLSPPSTLSIYESQWPIFPHHFVSKKTGKTYTVDGGTVVTQSIYTNVISTTTASFSFKESMSRASIMAF